MFQQCRPLLLAGNRINTPVFFFLFGLLPGSDSFLILFSFQNQLFLTFPDYGRKRCITIYSLQFPILFGHKIRYFQLPVYNECQRWRLYTTNGKYLFILSILHCIETGCIHSEQPVANSPAQSGFIERLKLFLILQFGKTFTDGFFRQR